jgi:citrate synthase
MSSPTIRASPRPPPATARSPIIDGDKGELLHRGYPIDQLAEKSHYLEVCYLLLYGELPDAASWRISRPRHQPHHAARADAATSSAASAATRTRWRSWWASSARCRPSTTIQHRHQRPAWQREVASIRLIAKMPTIAAWAYKYSIGQPFVYPRNDLDYAANFLRMCFAVPAEEYKVDPILSRAMDRIFTLHADHEQNASTSTVRLASSSGANPFACIAAGHRLPLGPRPWRRQPGLPGDAARDRHARPHPRVHRARQGQERSVPPDGLRPPGLQELRPAREGDEGKRRRGAGPAGHREQPDPAGRQGTGEGRAGRSLFREKKLYPNVDFYSGIILDAMGFPTSMFTPIFALSRTVGWISQWKETWRSRTATPAHREKIGRCPRAQL